MENQHIVQRQHIRIEGKEAEIKSEENEIFTKDND
jgi:hypothetical protein